MQQQLSPKLEAFICRNLDTYGPSFQAVRAHYHLNIPSKIPSDIPVYVCPLCINQLLFIRDSLLNVTADFSADHFPPESVGGKRKALVCKDCNSRFGDSFDFAPADSLRVINSLKGSGESTLNLQLEGSKSIYRLAANWTKDLISLKDNQKKSNLFHELVQSAQLMEETGQPVTFNLKMNLPSASLIMKSLLKAAYLYFFNWAGYEFVYSATASKIRKVLRGEIEHPLENFGVFYDQQLGQVDEGIYALTQPEVCKAFFVSLDIIDPITKRKIRNIIVIPSMKENAWDAQTAFTTWKDKEYMDVNFQRFSEEKMRRDTNYMYSQITKSLLS